MGKYLQSLLLFLLLAASANAQIGFGTSSPNSSLDVRGGVSLLPQLFTGNTTADASSQTFVFTGTAAATLFLPDALPCAGRVYWIKNASTTSPVPMVTVQPAGAQTIEGFGSIVIAEPNEVIRLVSDGAGWQAYSINIPVLKSSSKGPGWYQGGNSLTALKTVGTVTNIDMAFMTNNAERMRIANTGFVGLGTSSPAARFHVVNDNDDNGNEYVFTDFGSTNTGGIFLRKARGSAAAPANLQNGDHIAQLRFTARYNDDISRTSGSGLDAYYGGDGITNLSDFRFFTSNTERMRLSMEGNAAIGATTFSSSNTERLLIDAGNTNSYNVLSGKGSIDNYLQLNIRNTSNGTTASSDIVATADNGNESVNYIDLGINSNGFTNTTYPILGGINTAYLYGIGNDFVMGNGSPGYDLLFFTNGYNATNERMRVTASGNVGIGVTPTDKLTVGGIVSPAADNSWSLGNNGAAWSAVWATSGVIQTSDARVKTAIEPLYCKPQTIAQLNAVRYHWKKYADGNRKIGLLAQEVKRIIPEAVTGNEAHEYLSIDYSALIPVLVSVLQYQQRVLFELNKELDDLVQPGK